MPQLVGTRSERAPGMRDEDAEHDANLEAEGRPGTPHDRLFHHVFSNPAHAAGELRLLLPPELVRRIDWSTVVALPTRFVDPKLDEFRSDVLFSARLGKSEILLYLLLEHQSTSDPLMPFRLLEYVVKIWDHYLREHPGTRRFPAVVPMVLHHSKRGWNAPVTLRDLVDLDDDSFALMARFVPTFEFLLDDISKQDDDQIRARVLTDLARLTLLCLRTLSTSRNPAEDLRRWFDLCASVLRATDGTAAFSALTRYIRSTSKIPQDHLWAFARELGPKAEEVVMTNEQMLIAEGVAKGRIEGEAKVLLKQLAAKFGAVPESVRSRVQQASVDELDAWVERVLVAETLDAVFSK
jgi:predicted transposase/invertase (TIGR01784 family)